MAKRDQRTLTPKRQHFVTEYLKDFNGKQAAIRAGFAPGSAEVTASRLLRDAKVAEAIAKIQQQLQQKSGVTAERVIEELACVGFSDPRQVFGKDGKVLAPSQLPDAVARAIASIETTTRTSKSGKSETKTTIRFWSKPDALTTTARVLGMLRDKVEHSTPEGRPLRVSFGGRYRPDADGAASRTR